MQHSQKNRIQEWNCDVDKKLLNNSQAFYIKNRDFFTNLHTNAKGQSLGKNTSLNGNLLMCEVSYMLGEKYAVGSYYAELTNETYVWVYNSLGRNIIYRLSEKLGDVGCDVVYDFECLNLSVEPKNAITQWRATLLYDKTCKSWGGKRLVWADGEQIYCIDVEASIATNSFNVPYFTRHCNNYDRCELIQLCVPSNCYCPKARFITTPQDESNLNNYLTDKGFQFMYRFVYYDGRTSTWSDPSTFFFQGKGGCFDNNELSRCMEVRVPMGNPFVEYIELAVRNDNTNNWKIARRIKKYKEYNSSQQQFWQRQLSEEVSRGFQEWDCTFEIQFCNNDICESIDAKESLRVFNDFPRTAQGLFQYGDGGLAVYNYIKGNCPLPKNEIEKFKVELECKNSDCNIKYVEVKVRAVIHNFFSDRNEFIWKEGGAAGALNDDKTNIAYFGGLTKIPSTTGDLENEYDQQFSEKNRNFTVYIDGTDYFGEMQQYHCDAFFTNPVEWGVVGGVYGNGSGAGSQRTRWRKARNRGEFFYQEYTFKVPYGTKGLLRLQGHEVSEYNPKTSTQVSGIWDLNVYKGDITTTEGYTAGLKEIEFDTCQSVNGVLDIRNAFTVYDLSAKTEGVINLVPVATRYAGYVGYIKDCADKPIEYAQILVKNEILSETDWNGYYFGRIDANGSENVKVYAEQNCTTAHTEIQNESIDLDRGTTQIKNIKILNQTYCDGFKSKVVIKIVDCNNNPISGVYVAISGSKGGTTISNGETNIYIRNNSNRNRVVKAYLMDKKGCIILDCNNRCNPCLPSTEFTTPSCYENNPNANINQIIFKINTDVLAINSNGLKKNGRYKFGFVLQGDCGRFSFVNTNNNNFLEIPKQSGSFITKCRVKYNLTGLNLPSWVNCVKILRTKNQNDFQLQWVIDKVEEIDGKYKLTIQSLNDYNFNFGLKTNTVYQYLDGDRIELIADDKGNYFGNSLNYKTLSPFHDVIVSGKEDAPADYFNQLLIEADGRVSLKKGFVIELQRPKECVTEEEFYTICSTIKVKNGVVLNPLGFIDTFDTYYVKRKINNINYTLEHHSPSDFWGTKVNDIGLVHVATRLENERRYGRNITISGRNDISRFGDLEKTFDTPEQGEITAMTINNDNVLLSICEHGNFVSQKADEILRVTDNGLLRAIPADQIFSDPNIKLVGKYGCQYDHIGSIHFGDGYATWADVNKHAFILHDYNNAKEASFTKISSWCLQKFQQIETHNRKQTDPLNKFRFTTGHNHVSEEVMLTIKRFRDSGIDNQFEPYKSPNETIVYNPISDKFYGHRSYTPDCYSRFNLFDDKGCQFLTILNGDIWNHPIKNDIQNQFYGVEVDSVVGVCLNEVPEKIKVALAFEIQSNKKWFLWQSKTDNPNFISETPVIRVKGTEFKFNGEFLHNKLGRGGIYANAKNHSENTRGYYISCIFVRDNTDSEKYNTINENKQIQFDELDMILFKYMISEQSGFTNNL